MPIFWSVVAVLPHITLFFRDGGDYFGGELDEGHECLWRLVTVEMHHLNCRE